MMQISHDQASRLDFVEGVRRHNYATHVRELIDSYPERVGAAGSPPSTWRDVGRLYDRDPAYLLTCGIQRCMQEIAWNTAAESVADNATKLAAELDQSTAEVKYGTLELDPGAELPEWYTEHSDTGRDDIHLVPQGYWGNSLVGALYELGGAVYRLAWRAGYDARPGALEHFVAKMPRDARLVLDLGCAFGGLTRVLARGLPEARVIGLDLSEAALRYAHRISEQAGVAVHFRQCDVERTGYDNDSVDVVTAFLLMHEVPTPVRVRILAEAFRVLRPGGRLMILDIPPYSALSPVEGWFESFDDRGNGENFWTSYLDSDFPEVLEGIGFTDIADGPLDFDDPDYWGSAALWRTGEFNPVHRWVTTATKPEEPA